MVLLYTVRSSDKRASRLVLVDEWKGLGCERGWCGRVGLGAEDAWLRAPEARDQLALPG